MSSEFNNVLSKKSENSVPVNVGGQRPGPGEGDKPPGGHLPQRGKSEEDLTKSRQDLADSDGVYSKDGEAKTSRKTVVPDTSGESAKGTNMHNMEGGKSEEDLTKSRQDVADSGGGDVGYMSGSYDEPQATSIKMHDNEGSEKERPIQENDASLAASISDDPSDSQTNVVLDVPLAEATTVYKKCTVAEMRMLDFGYISVQRNDLVQIIKKLHEDNPDFWRKRPCFKYEGDVGCDEGGVTRDVMATLWEKCRNVFVTDIPLTVVPCEQSSDLYELYSKMLIHSFVLTCQVPWYLNPMFVLSIFCSPNKTTPELLKRCVELFIEDQPKYIQEKLMTSCSAGLSSENKAEMEEFFDTYRYTSDVSLERAEDFQSHLVELFMECMFRKPPCFVQLCREKLEKMVGPMTAANAFEVLDALQPTGEKIILHLKTDSPEETVFLKKFLISKGEDVDLMKRFLKFVTGSAALTEPVINVKAENQFSYPRATPCNYTIILPSGITSYVEFETVMLAILNSNESQRFTDY